MSFVKDLVFGQEGTPAQLIDLRSDNATGLENDTVNVLRDLIQGHFTPRFEGDMVAALTNQEQQLLGALPGLFGPAQTGFGIGQDVLNRVAGGGAANPLIQGIAGIPGVTGDTFRSLGDLVSGRTLDPNHPIIQRQIQAATRPIFEAFDDNLANLTSAATQAGQFVQPGSSSPFELAKARLQTGLANAIGDTSANIVTQNVNRERDRQLNLTGLLGNTFQQGESLALQGANSQVPFQRGQLGGIMDALNISALPRQITQLGLDRGMEEFNRQQQRLLSVLGLGLQGSRPQTASLPGQEGTTGLLGSALTAGATALGGPLGGALANAII